MKVGLTINELGQEIARQNESKRDYITPTTEMTILAFDDEEGTFAVEFDVPSSKKTGRARTEMFELNRYALGQIATHTKVPINLIDIMKSSTMRERMQVAELLSVRLQENEALRMLRTMETKEGQAYARAFLSDKYRRLDNYDLAGAVLPVLHDLGLGNDTIKSSEITDERMYIKVVNPEMAFDLGPTVYKGRSVGDIIEAGVSISNSEVGSGSLRIEPFIFRLVCLNGAIANDHALRKAHVGRSNGHFEFDSAYELFSEDTLSLDDAAFYRKVEDITRATLGDEDKFMKIATNLLEIQDNEITGDVEAAVRVLGQKFSITEEHTSGILNHLIKGGDLSQYGVFNAVTAYARDDRGKLSYDEATEFEYIGGKVIELGKADWRVIAEAHSEEAKSKRKTRRK